MEIFHSRRRVNFSRSSLLDDGEDLELQRRRNEQKLQGRFSAIYAKYERDFEDSSDVIDIVSGSIVIDNGHVAHMRHERDLGTNRSRGRFNAIDFLTEEDELSSPPGSSHSGSSQSRLGSGNCSDSDTTSDLAAHVVQSAMPPMADCNPLDPSFVASFSENIKHQVAQFMRNYGAMAMRQSVSTASIVRPRSRDVAVPTFPGPASISPVRRRRSGYDRPMYQSDESRTTVRIKDSRESDLPSSYITSVSLPRPKRSNRAYIWSEQEDEAVLTLMQPGKKDWDKIGFEFPQKSVPTLYRRYHYLQKIVAARKKARPEREVYRPSATEDNQLWTKSIWYVEDPAGDEPDKVPKCGKNIWTAEDMRLLIRLRDEEGLTYRQIAQYLPGRTQPALRQRYIRAVEAVGPLKAGNETSDMGRLSDIPNARSKSAPKPLLDEANDGSKQIENASKISRGCTRDPASLWWWREDEDDLLIDLRVRQRLSWSAVARHFPTRTVEALHNRYRKIKTLSESRPSLAVHETRTEAQPSTSNVPQICQGHNGSHGQPSRKQPKRRNRYAEQQRGSSSGGVDSPVIPVVGEKADSPSTSKIWSPPFDTPTLQHEDPVKQQRGSVQYHALQPELRPGGQSVADCLDVDELDPDFDNHRRKTLETSTVVPLARALTTPQRPPGSSISGQTIPNEHIKNNSEKPMSRKRKRPTHFADRGKALLTPADSSPRAPYRTSTPILTPAMRPLTASANEHRQKRKTTSVPSNIPAASLLRLLGNDRRKAPHNTATPIRAVAVTSSKSLDDAHPKMCPRDLTKVLPRVVPQYDRSVSIVPRQSYTPRLGVVVPDDDSEDELGY